MNTSGGYIRQAGGFALELALGGFLVLLLMMTLSSSASSAPPIGNPARPAGATAPSFDPVAQVGTPCAITCPSDITVSNDPGQCGAVVNYPDPIVTGDCGMVTCSPPAGSFFPVGTTTVTCSTTAGPSCSFDVTVDDTEPPTITCPSDLTVVGTPGSGSTVVTFSDPVATDNCPGVVANCVPPSGSTFPTGTTTVTCTATDASGNTASCSFNVTVFDVCLQDDSSGAVLVFNSFTGDYQFCCRGGFSLSGKGKARRNGNFFTLTQGTTETDRRVTASLDASLKRGSASLQSPPGQTRCTIMDRNTSNNTCVCP